jgi:glycosyltransferase involved in cell wall biosynthesis
MRIVFDARVHLNYYSGISRYIIGLIEAYASLFPADEMLVLLNPSIKADNVLCRLIDRFPQVTYRIIDAGHMGPSNYLKMGKIIKTMEPDVYHYPHLDAPIFTGNIPVVATVHDSNSNNKVKKFDDRFGLKGIYFKIALKLTLKRTQKVIFVSDSIKNEILTQFKIPDNPKKYSRIYNGFEPSFGQVNANTQSQIIQSLGIKQPFILVVGQIREHKNVLRSVAAFNLFQQENPAYQLVIVGHNYLNLDLSSSHIIQFDKVNNETLKVLYSTCSAFLFPSLFEGFGFPILEAFAFGKPVVTSNYGATAEVSGGLATLVNPLDIQAIKQGIEQALKTKEDADKRIAHAAKFSWEDYARSLRAVYLAAIEG